MHTLRLQSPSCSGVTTLSIWKGIDYNCGRPVWLFWSPGVTLIVPVDSKEFKMCEVFHYYNCGRPVWPFWSPGVTLIVPVDSKDFKMCEVFHFLTPESPKCERRILCWFQRAKSVGGMPDLDIAHSLKPKVCEVWQLWIPDSLLTSHVNLIKIQLNSCGNPTNVLLQPSAYLLKSYSNLI